LQTFKHRTEHIKTSTQEFQRLKRKDTLKSSSASLESLEKQTSLIWLISYEGMNLKSFLDKELTILFQRDTVVASYKCTWDVGDNGRFVVLH